MVTVDSNITVYALSTAGWKKQIATKLIGEADFISVQVLNEFANVAWRKQGRTWPEIARSIADLRSTVGRILPIEEPANADAVRLAGRYQLNFYDALMLAVALSGGARTFYSEDMQHGMIIDGALRIIDPFRQDAR